MPQNSRCKLDKHYFSYEKVYGTVVVCLRTCIVNCELSATHRREPREPLYREWSPPRLFVAPWFLPRGGKAYHQYLVLGLYVSENKVAQGFAANFGEHLVDRDAGKSVTRALSRPYLRPWPVSACVGRVLCVSREERLRIVKHGGTCPIVRLVFRRSSGSHRLLW